METNLKENEYLRITESLDYTPVVNQPHNFSENVMLSLKAIMSTDTHFWAPKSLQMVTAAMKLKDACSLQEKL